MRSRKKEYSVYGLLFFAMLSSFIFLHVYKMGAVSPTKDELIDLGILGCLNERLNPFKCYDDISQTRFVYYVYGVGIALINPLFGLLSPYVISTVFNTLLLLEVFFFARKEYGIHVALMTALLMTLSPQIIASGRMLLTHSNVVATFLNVSTVILFYYYLKYGKPKYMILSAVSFGLAVGSTMVAATSIIYILTMYVLNNPKIKSARQRELLFLPISVVTFFASTIIYLDKNKLKRLINSTLNYGFTKEYVHWNYLGLGSHKAPPFFSFLLLVIKLTPWWTLFIPLSFLIALREKKDLKHDFIKSTLAYILFICILRSFIATYDAPHHQVLFYPFAYLSIAYGTHSLYSLISNKLAKKIYITLITAFIVMSSTTLATFFPNLIFQGAEYGETFIGEFYGPAVILCQDMDVFIEKVEETAGDEPVIYDGQSMHCLEIALQPRLKNLVPFNKIESGKKYGYAVDSYLQKHFNLENKEQYQAYLYKNCVEAYSYNFPLGYKMYTLYKCD